MRTFERKSGTSADNATAVTLNVNQAQTKHTIYSTFTGTVTGGTLSISLNVQTVAGTIDCTAPAPQFVEAHANAITVTPAGLDAGATFTIDIISTP